MAITVRLQNAWNPAVTTAAGRLVTWLRRRRHARQRRAEMLNLMLMTPHLRRDMGLQDYEITHRRP